MPKCDLRTPFRKSTSGRLLLDKLLYNSLHWHSSFFKAFDFLKKLKNDSLGFAMQQEKSCDENLISV